MLFGHPGTHAVSRVCLRQQWNSLFSPSAFQASLQTSTVEVSNRTTGAAVSLIKKINVPKHFAARRAMALVAARAVSLPLATEVSDVETAGTKAAAAEFIEDFFLEHSSSSVLVSPKE